MGNLTNDINLWKAFKKGDQKAFHLIYQQHYSSLFYYALKVTQNREVAKDCLQNLFINLWSHRQNLAEVSMIKSYLFKSLRRDLNRIPYTLVLKKENEAVLLQSQVGPTFSPEDIVVDDETKQFQQTQIAHVLNKLPARQREAVYLKYYEALDYKEIAQIMGVNYQSVVNILYKAMTNLKKKENLQKLILLMDTLLLLASLNQHVFY